MDKERVKQRNWCTGRKKKYENFVLSEKNVRSLSMIIINDGHAVTIWKKNKMSKIIRVLMVVTKVPEHEMTMYAFNMQMDICFYIYF